MTDLELDAIEKLYARAVGGLQGAEPPPRIRALGDLLREVRALRRQVNTLVEQLEAA